MKKANRLFFLLILLAVAPALNAQVNARLEDELLEALEGVSDLEGSLSRVVLDQASSNSVQIEQYNRQYAEVLQNGNFNEVYLRMDGDENAAALRQNGNNNYIEIDLYGADSTIGAIQEGNDNSLLLDYQNVEDINARFIQNGTNINVTHRAQDVDGLDYTIQFTGHDMNIQVEDVTNYLIDR